MLASLAPAPIKKGNEKKEEKVGGYAPRPAANKAGQRGGKRYSDWRCLEKSKSPEWDKIINDLAAEITTRHYSRKTLKAYADWSRKFQSYLKNKAPDGLSTTDVKAYLTYLAVKCKVSASTQNQAFNALLFLYRHILKKDFGDHKDIPRAKRLLLRFLLRICPAAWSDWRIIGARSCS